MRDEKHRRGVADGFENERMLIVPQARLRAVERLPVLRDVRVTHIGQFKAGANHRVVRRDGAREHVLIYCLSGAGGGRIRKKTFAMRAGDLVVLPPGAQHVYHADPDNPWTIFWFHFTGMRADDYVKAMGFDGKKIILTVPRITEMGQAFEEAYRQALAGFTPEGLLGLSTEFVRMVGMFRRYSNADLHRREVSRDRIVEVILRMQNEIARHWTLPEMAALAGMSASHFVKRFKQQTGEAPLAYVIHQRMQRAAVILQRGERWIGEIARTMGYEDPYYFSRIFKSVHGVSPMEYRRRCRLPL